MDKDFYSIRWANGNEWSVAMALAWKTFLEFEAQDYTPEGVKNFHSFITGRDIFNMFLNNTYKLAVASIGKEIVGMISIRSQNHISLLFVDKQYHQKGIGRNLVQFLAEFVRKEGVKNSITVESSPYAIEFYHTIGFQDIGEVKYLSGIITTPMERVFSLQE